MRRLAVLGLVFALSPTLWACGAADAGGDVDDALPFDETGDAATPSDDAMPSIDARPDVVADAGDAAAPDAAPKPPPTRDGESKAVDGDNPISIPAKGEKILRVETKATEHVHFMLTFSPSSQPVVLHVDRWDGAAPKPIGSTDAGGGLRTLAVFDGTGPATYWVRVTSSAAFTGTLKVTRTPFADALHCPSDCAHLLQMPLPNDPAVDGYATDSGTIFRYWFGRRDMLMLLRNAAHRMVQMKKPAFYPYDFSQWDGETPGTDVGAPRHASHQRGKDVDVSLYGSDGGSMWRSFCTTTPVSGGRECVKGTGKGLDDRTTARELAGFYEGDIVTMMFLDQELIGIVRPAAPKLAADGVIDADLVPLYSDGTHLQHWPNHDNHVHVRVSEGAKMIIGTEPIEPP
ncbi:MAG: hypothetical protein ABI175_29285 [Polyangiales bacterium]